MRPEITQVGTAGVAELIRKVYQPLYFELDKQGHTLADFLTHPDPDEFRPFVDHKRPRQAIAWKTYDNITGKTPYTWHEVQE